MFYVFLKKLKNYNEYMKNWIYKIKIYLFFNNIWMSISQIQFTKALVIFKIHKIKSSLEE